ncbi:acyl-CoA thioesterase [Thomasclavelia cocleata]|jgi:acyl-CoA thioester hydrolase|uniref:Acyl-CoA thioester hydrolase n=1 Tax=Thomasclavelia cocleata TaxID=69824 RepID=A0A1I0GAN8_9FIRM|nr:thioesterase family protein [Thomasclavelia cocleata]MCR1960948.1 acyl-CoA thioesterase [Thomasclavelia cocleata]NDO43381.1 acyl-CoA thioesterase [Thomasclavelia cocleata]PJN79662.1 acyl-CoA thioesterase [Thomasclavelia cocleata]SET67182.1 acyl-CoA thioester hydrolase [Thomasclavelia cocleata]
MNINPYQHHAKYYETDQMGIIHHSNYIRWFEEARIDFMNQIGLTYKTMEEEGIISPVLEINCKYLKMMYFDDIATIKLKISSYTGVRFTFEYEIYNQDKQLCTIGSSSHCFMNRKNRPISLKKLKPEFDELFKKLLAK